MHTNTTVALKPNEFLSCISLNMHFLQSLLKFKNFIITIPRYLLFIFLVKNTVFMSVYHVKAVKDDISVKSVPIASHCKLIFFLFKK